MNYLPHLTVMRWVRSLIAIGLVCCTSLCWSASDATGDASAWSAFVQKSAPAATERYASADPLQELEIYPARPGVGTAGRPTPVLMLVHGGGWGGGSRDALAPHARYFAALGWNSVNISYRLTSLPGVTVMNAQEDVRAAFAWIRTQASQRGWDARRIVVLGESAGGQLACAIGILPPDAARWQPHSLVLVNPVIDLTSLPWALNQPGLREAGAYEAATADKHPAFAVSPLFHVTRSSPPTLLIHGRGDTVVPFAQAEAYAARAKNTGAKLELVALEKTGHAFLLNEFGSPEVIRATLQRITQFLNAP
ncbi:MAG: alpha/beta hydrolase [Opitutaceae bacterium]